MKGKYIFVQTLRDRFSFINNETFNMSKMNIFYSVISDCTKIVRYSLRNRLYGILFGRLMYKNHFSMIILAVTIHDVRNHVFTAFSF